MLKQVLQFFFYTFLIASFAMVAFVVNQVYLKPTPGLEEFKKVEDDYKLVDSLVTKKKVKLSTGITMSLYESGVQKEDNVIIFSHGFPEFGLVSWKNQIPFFTEKGYFVVVPNHRGSDETQDESFENYMNCNADVASDDIKALVEHYNVSKITLVGHDWGAGVAYRFALKYQHLLSKLIILNMPHPLIKVSNFPVSQLLKSWYILFFQLTGISESAVRADDFGFFRRLFHKMDYTRDDMERLLESYKKDKHSVTRMLNWYRFFVRYEIPNRTVPKKMIDVPFKVIWGINDLALHENLGPLSVDKSLCSQGELVQINGTHFVQHSNPNEVNEEIYKFIKK